MPQTIGQLRLDGLLREWPQAHHLFDLGDEVENRLEAKLSEQTAIDIPPDPIRTRDELAAVLHTIAPEPPAIALQPTESNRMVRLGDEVASLPVVDRAVVLAWAYTKPAAESLIVPFYLPAWEQG